MIIKGAFVPRYGCFVAAQGYDCDVLGDLLVHVWCVLVVPGMQKIAAISQAN